MRAVKQIVVVTVLAVVGGSVWTFRDKLPFLPKPVAVSSTAPARAQPVEIAKVATRSMSTQIETVASAQANESITVTAKTAGIVKKIQFQEGQRVAAGQILIELDYGEAQAKIDEMRAARDTAKANLDRARQLLLTNNVAKARVEELEKIYEGSEARIRAEQAKFADFIIRAPFAGKVGLRQVSLGALIRPGEPITTLDDDTVIKLEFDVTEADYGTGQVRIGRTVHASGAGVRDREFQGKISMINTRLDPATRTVRVRADIPNPDEVLKPGMFLNARINLEVRPNSIVVPEEALLARGDKQYVFVVRDNVAYQTPVTINQRRVGVAEVLSGLNVGDVVVVAGVQQLRDKMAVRITNQPPTGTAAQPKASAG